MSLTFSSSLNINGGSGGGTISGDLKLKNATVYGNVNIGINGFSNYGYYGFVQFADLGASTNNPYAIQIKMTTSNTSYNSKDKQWFGISNSNQDINSSNIEINGSTVSTYVPGTGSITHGSIVLPSLTDNSSESYAPTIQIYRFEIDGVNLTAKQKNPTDEQFTTKFTGNLQSGIPFDNYFNMNLLGQSYNGRNIQGMIYFEDTFIQDLTTGEILWQPKIIIE